MSRDLELDALRAENAELRADVKRLTDLNKTLSDSLASAPEIGTNTAMLLGAAFSGGDMMAMAKDLAAREKTRTKLRGARSS